jgi:hypothetical protein
MNNGQKPMTKRKGIMLTEQEESEGLVLAVACSKHIRNINNEVAEIIKINTGEGVLGAMILIMALDSITKTIQGVKAEIIAHTEERN